MVKFKDINPVDFQLHNNVTNKLVEAWNEFMTLQEETYKEANGNAGTHADNLNDFRKVINDGHRIITQMKHGPFQVFK